MPAVRLLAALVDGEVVGDAEREIRGVADLSSAAATDISFLANPKYVAEFAATRAGAVLLARPVPQPTPDACTLILCADPYLAMARVATHLFAPPAWQAGIAPSAHVDPAAHIDATACVRPGAIVEAGAQVGPRSIIGAGCYVGHDATVGADCLLHPGVRLLHRCRLGDRVILHSGVVVGSDGFGYAPDAQGRRYKIPQVGIVDIGDDVEIGANSTIDRATFGVTRIGAGCKIDNLVQIAHNVVLGRDCVVVSQSGIAGSTSIGDRVVIGAQGGIVGHIHIADDVILGARAGVPNSVKQAGIYSGSPIMPHRQWLKMTMAQQAVPELRSKVRALHQRLEVLENNDGSSPRKN